jgi:hypothetical protein
MIRDLERLVASVQANCHVADARHAADLTLCTYLLAMREFYRWEHGIAFAEQLSRADLGAWLAEREALWESLQGREFEDLSVDGRRYEPFAVGAINGALTPHGLVYSAGLGRFGRAQFHLGELKRQERRGDVWILVGGREYARDLGAAPAVLLDATIYVRQEALRSWLWEKFETWGVHKPDGALRAVLTAYGFAGDPLAALERMTDAETETLIQHELGELEAGRRLGSEWERLRASAASRRIELMLRAIRDNFADCLVTLPALLERQAEPSIHFWFATFEGLRRELFPRLVVGYDAWRKGGDGRALSAAVDAGAAHWRNVCTSALAHSRRRGADVESAIEALLLDEGTRL